MKSIRERLEKLTDSDLIDLAHALRFLCPCSDCEDCPIYNGEYEKYNSGCLAIQSLNEAIFRGIVEGE